MNGLTKHFFTTNCPVAQLVKHKTDNPRGICWCEFHKMNRCHCLLVTTAKRFYLVKQLFVLLHQKFFNCLKVNEHLLCSVFTATAF